LWTGAATVLPWQEVSRSRAGAGKQPGFPQPGQCTQHRWHAVTVSLRRPGNLWIPDSCAGEDFPVKSFLEVVTVAGTVDSGRRHSILNSDGQPHPVQNILTI